MARFQLVVWFVFGVPSKTRNKIAGVMESIVGNASDANGDLTHTILSTMAQPLDFDCAEAVVDTFSNLCFNVAEVTGMFYIFLRKPA